MLVKFVSGDFKTLANEAFSVIFRYESAFSEKLRIIKLDFNLASYEFSEAFIER